MRTDGRAVRAIGIGALAIAALAGCTSVATSDSRTPAGSDAGSGAGSGAASAAAAIGSAAAATRSTTRAPATAQSSARAGGVTAVDVLAGLAVKGRAPKTGYNRAAFGPAWTDDNDDPDGHNGCDTRNDILRRDLTDVVLKSDTHGCTVLAGTLLDPYTGTRIAFHRGVGTSSAVQIDHVVALSDAWQTGAQYWTAQRRRDFANDPLELLAVSGPTNDAKGDGDAATWLPPNRSYRCAYVARQTAVKARYGLWMTAAEKAATAHVLASCPGQRAPTEAGAVS